LPDRSALTNAHSGVTVTGVKPAPELEALRRSIDDLDGRILQLVAERVKVVLAVGQFKRENNLAVYDPERERKMLDRLCGQAPAPLDGETVRRIFERLIDESRRIEQHSIGKHST
jgi:chorismate mutase